VSLVADLRAVLREPHFGKLYATRLGSQCSDGIFQVALASFVFFSPEKQTDANQAAASFATLLLPYSLVGPFAGVLLDRWSRQRILVLANLVRALGVVGVAALVAAGVDGPVFYASTLAVLSVNRFVLASLSASLPHVVTSREWIMANSLSVTSGTLVALLGAGLGYGARRLVGENDAGSATIMVLAALGYVAAAVVATRMDRALLGPDLDGERPETREALRRVVSGVVDGARHVWHHREAGHALAAIAAHRFFYGLSTIATVLLYRNYFHDATDVEAGLGGLGIVLLASGVGFLLAAVVTPEVTPRVGEQVWIVWCFAGAAVVELALGLPYTHPSIVAAAFFLGFVAQASKICVDTLVQRTIDDAYRGRVFSFYDIIFNVAFVAAAAVAALVLPQSGKSYPVLVTIAVGYAVTACGYGWASRRRP